MPRIIPDCKKLGDGTGGGESLLVQDEGIDVESSTTTINFIGAGVTATSGGAGIVDVTIPGGGGANSNDSLLLFGAGSIGGSPTIRYAYPGYDDGLAQAVVIQIDAPYAGTLRDFYVRHNTPGTSTTNITYTVRINDVATGITTTLAANASNAFDTVNTAAVVAGNRIDIEITKPGNIAPGSGPTDITCTINLKVA